MLGYEHRVATHRRLSAVVWDVGRGKALTHKVFGMATYSVKTFFHDIILINRLQPETAAESRARQPLEQVAEVVIFTSACRFGAFEILISKKAALYKRLMSVSKSHFCKVFDPTTYKVSKFRAKTNKQSEKHA